jgi:hypothetical protein
MFKTLYTGLLLRASLTAELMRYPGFETQAITTIWTNVRALQEMVRRNVEALIVVNDRNEIEGVIEREQVVSLMMLSLVNGAYLLSVTFQQALRVDRPPSPLSFATPSFLPATQGQRCTGEAELSLLTDVHHLHFRYPLRAKPYMQIPR